MARPPTWAKALDIRSQLANCRGSLGSQILARVAQGKLEELVLRGWLEEGLTEAQDRGVFGLPAK
jgi:hypothetical protein